MEMTELNARIGIATSVALFAAACTQEPQEPEIGIKEFMVEHVEPTAQTYWQSVVYISDETGYHEIVPETDADWERVIQAAEDIGVFGELLQTRTYAEGRGQDWTQIAQGLVDAAEQAKIAAQNHNVEDVFEAGGTLYNVCSACHQFYLPAEGENPVEVDPGDEAR